MAELTMTVLAFMMAKPPPMLYVLDKTAAQSTTADEFEKSLEKMPTATEGTEENTAPPAALLAPGAHDAEDVTELQFMNVQLIMVTPDERPIA